MAKKTYLISVGDDDNIFDAIILFTLGALVVGALFVAALYAIPVIIGGILVWRMYRGAKYAPASVARREIAEIGELHNSVKYLADRVTLPDPKDLARTVIYQVDQDLDHDRAVPDFMYQAIEDGTKEVLKLSGLAPVPRLDTGKLTHSVDARNAFRNELYDLQKLYQGGETSVDEVFRYLCNCVGYVCERLPMGDGIGDEPNDFDLTVEVLDVLTDTKTLAEIILYLPFGDGDMPALTAIQDRSLARMSAISGKSINDILDNPHKAPKPTEDKRPAKEVFQSYLSNWPLMPMLYGRVAYRIPAESRFEHMHILGGTGHGKTQLLQRFIREDLTDIYFGAKFRAAGSDDGPRPKSLVVMDGQGDLIRNVARRSFCASDGPLQDRVLLIDPTDTEYPLALNMFDLNTDELDRMRPSDREMVYNGTIELYVYLFGALLDAELTQKQDVLFRYIARLMLAIPEATLETLRDVIENGEAYQPYIDKLDYSATEFFRTQYFSKEFDETKKQLLRRLWGVLSNSALANMFNSPVNKIDLFEELQRGSVILINTAKDYLKTDGSRIFGRFWVAMLAQAALRRAALSPYERVDTHVYIDEAHEVIDDKVEEILNQARKYRISLTLAHQNRKQLSPGARATLASSTAIKMVGGVSEEDARGYAGELRTDAATIMAAKKRKGGAEFVTYVRNHVDQAITLNVGFGTLERMDEMGWSGLDDLRDRVRERYCRSRHDMPGPQPTSASSADAAAGEFELGDHEDI